MEQKKKVRYFSRLAMKFVIGFVLIGVLICAACSTVGYFRYKASIEKLYNDTAYQIAEVARSYIGDADLERYVNAAIGAREGSVTQEELDAMIAEETYRSVTARLEALRAGMGANDIFFVYLDHPTLLSYNGAKEDWTPLSYIFDSYTVPELNYRLGDQGPFNPDYIDEAYQITTTGERSDNYFISKSDYGYNTSAMLPVTNAEGKVIASIGVEIPMLTIETDLKNYLVFTLLSTVGMVVFCLLIYITYLFMRVIRPINEVAGEVSGFVENETAVSDSLQNIRTKDEIQTLAENTLKMQYDIKNYNENLTKVTAEKERIGAELNVAAQIQASMLPCIFPPFPDRKEFDVFATMDPAKEVGGDFYDFFMVDENHVAMVMADVSGKGVPAALFMVIAKTLIKDHTLPDRELGDVFGKVNELLCEANSEGLFVTAFEGVLDLVSGEFRFVNAGHEMPFICRKGGVYEPHKIRPGFVLAGMEGTRYRADSITLEPGDKIFEYTDGVTEATDAENRLYGMERLQNVLAANADKSPTDLLPAVKADIDAFVGDAPQFDDITMLSLEYKAGGGAGQ